MSKSYILVEKLGRYVDRIWLYEKLKEYLVSVKFLPLLLGSVMGNIVLNTLEQPPTDEITEVTLLDKVSVDPHNSWESAAPVVPDSSASEFETR